MAERGGCFSTWFPDEILLEILFLLEAEEVLRCRRVSLEWRRLAEDSLLWKRLWWRHFGGQRLRWLIPAARVSEFEQTYWLNLYRRALASSRIFVFGGACARFPWQYLDSCEVYSLTTRTWELIPPLPSVRSFLGCAVAAGRIYVVGGEAGDVQTLDSVDSYDPMERAWLEGPSMHVTRRRHGVCASPSEKFVYAVGGIASDRSFCRSMERLDTQAGVWEFVRSLPEARASFAVGFIRGKMYVVGGCNSDLLSVSDVVAYDEEHDVWQKMPPLRSSRQNLCMATVRDRFLYAIGGSMRTDTLVFDKLSTVERFDVEKMQWEIMNPMPGERYGSAAVAVLDAVYVLGGDEADYTLVPHVQRLDTRTGQWSSVPSMRFRRGFHCAAAMFVEI